VSTTEGTEMAAEPQVLSERRGHLGHIILNRPRAINALSHEMISIVRDLLTEWAEDDSVQTVLLTGNGERGLCAGGDIVSLYNDARSGDIHSSAAYWADEYRMIAQIANYPKPYVAIQDGIVLGGGIGLSAHGSHRVVTERSKLGMPETAIGFIPDVGGTWLLSRAPGELGTYVALTSGQVKAGDAIALGLSDCFVPSDRLPALITALETKTADAAIAAFSVEAPAAELPAKQVWIDAAFSAGTVEEIIRRLSTFGVEQELAVAETIRAMSPTALAVTLQALRRASRLGSLEEALDQEYRVSLRGLVSPDFAEGVRARVIDKDRNPQWRPATLDAVSAPDVEAFFAPLGTNELNLEQEKVKS
jgi:enoyl-CoA hydratase